MKDKNGIEVKCWNCALFTQGFCAAIEVCPECYKRGYFNPTTDAYKTRIAELQEVIKLDLKSVNIDDINDALTKACEDKIKELEEGFFATVELLGEIGQERDSLREEVQNLKKENERLSQEIIDLGTGTLAEKK